MNLRTDTARFKDRSYHQALEDAISQYIEPLKEVAASAAGLADAVRPLAQAARKTKVPPFKRVGKRVTAAVVRLESLLKYSRESLMEGYWHKNWHSPAPVPDDFLDYMNWDAAQNLILAGAREVGSTKFIAAAFSDQHGYAVSMAMTDDQGNTQDVRIEELTEAFKKLQKLSK